MDLEQVINELIKERNRLDSLIRALERGVEPRARGPARSTRGRKSMAPEERLQVAERMRQYWAARKHAATPHPSEGDSGSPGN